MQILFKILQTATVQQITENLKEEKRSIIDAVLKTFISFKIILIQCGTSGNEQKVSSN